MLEPSAKELLEFADATNGIVADYLAGLRERRIYPETSAHDIRARLDSALPHEGSSFNNVLATFRDVIVPLSRHNGHPRMFGYVQSPGTPIAAFADLLASTLNANLTAWRSAPAPVELERLTIDWIRQILGFEARAGGLFVSGGSIANLSALAVARQVKAPANFAEQGAFPASGKLCIYASEETHHSIAKAAALLGIGRANLRAISCDQHFKIRIDDLVQKITADFDAGHTPMCVVANAGTVNTGAVDPLTDIREIADRFGLWMHVDASYGGFAVLAPSARALFHGIGTADSVALDPHKWLYLPVDSGCVIYRDPEKARMTFAHDADYTRVIGEEADEAFAYWDYGPELSRRFRALKVWMLLKAVGLRSLGEEIDKNLACARHLEVLVEESDDFEMLAPLELSIFCFRYVPADVKNQIRKADAGSRTLINEQLNRLNERLLVALQREGSSYLSNANLHGQFSLRGCVLNYRTTPRDMEILLDDLRRVAASLDH